MERLTYEIIDGGMVTDKENIKEFEIEDGFTVYAGNAVFRLADYEDTGLTPQEIMDLKERDTAMEINEIHVDEYYCPACGAENNCDQGVVEDNFCPRCGQRFWEDE